MEASKNTQELNRNDRRNVVYLLDVPLFTQWISQINGI